MSSSRPPSKAKPMGSLQQELQLAVDNISCKGYVPAIDTRSDTTDRIPELAVLVVGNDDRVTAALANSVRVFLEQHMHLPTVALGNLQENVNYVDYEDAREEHSDVPRDYQNDMILEQVESVWDGMCNSYPAFRRNQVRIGVEIIRGNVNITKEVRHSAVVQIGTEKVVDQVLTTIYP